MSFGLGGNQTPFFPFHMHCLFVCLFVQFISHFNFPNNSSQVFGKLLSSLLCILVLIDYFQLPLSVDSLFFVVQGDPSKEASIHPSLAQLNQLVEFMQKAVSARCKSQQSLFKCSGCRTKSLLLQPSEFLLAYYYPKMPTRTA